MSFCAAINCIDGRALAPVVDYAQRRFRVRWVDLITEPGPARILAENHERALVASILRRLELSIRAHGVTGVAVAAHYGCAANPSDEATQRRQVRKAVELLSSRYPACEVIGLWVDRTWTAHELSAEEVEQAG